MMRKGRSLGKGQQIFLNTNTSPYKETKLKTSWKLITKTPNLNIIYAAHQFCCENVSFLQGLRMCFLSFGYPRV